MPAPYATAEELTLIKTYVILTLLLSVFERDKSAISSVVKTPAPYTDAIDHAMDHVSAKMAEIRGEFRKRGIKVHDTERRKDDIKTGYVCRGYSGEMSLLWTYLRAEIEVKMREYLGEDITKYETRNERK